MEPTILEKLRELRRLTEIPNLTIVIFGDGSGRLEDAGKPDRPVLAHFSRKSSWHQLEQVLDQEIEKLKKPRLTVVRFEATGEYRRARYGEYFLSKTQDELCQCRDLRTSEPRYIFRCVDAEED